MQWGWIGELGVYWAGIVDGERAHRRWGIDAQTGLPLPKPAGDYPHSDKRTVPDLKLRHVQAETVSTRVLSSRA